jgi:hypothetical protein
VRASDLESQYAAFESAGLVVIYSCDVLAPETKKRFARVAMNRFFDLSVLQLPLEESETVQKILSQLRSFRA